MADSQYFLDKQSSDLKIEDLLEVRGGTLVLKGLLETTNFLSGQSGIRLSQEGLDSSVSSFGTQEIGNLTATGSITHTGTLIGLYGATPTTQAGASANLTNSTTGTADGTVSDVGGAFNQATLNNNFAEVTIKINAILNALRNIGIIDT